MKNVDEASDMAADLFNRGYNCAEAVLRAVCDAQGVDLPDRCLRMATPFGGGIGRSEDVCGALAGGVMAVGACLGRAAADGDKKASYETANRLFSMFVKEHGSCKCRDINKGDFSSPEHRARCTGFVRTAARFSLLAVRDRPA